jgi:hypothetical protein
MRRRTEVASVSLERGANDYYLPNFGASPSDRSWSTVAPRKVGAKGPKDSSAAPESRRSRKPQRPSIHPCASMWVMKSFNKTWSTSNEARWPPLW